MGAPEQRRKQVQLQVGQPEGNVRQRIAVDIGQRDLDRHPVSAGILPGRRDG